MAIPFERFETELTIRQIALLLDTVSYFQDAPKLLSLPRLDGQSVAVPLLPETLQALLAVAGDAGAEDKQRIAFEWIETDEDKGTLVLTLSTGERLQQPTELSRFSPV